MKARERGAVAMEFALLVPVLLLITGVAVDLGLMMLTRAEIEESAQEAAVHVARYPNEGDAAKQRAVERAGFVDLTTADVTISKCTGSGTALGRKVTVRVATSHDMLFAGILPGGDSVDFEGKVVTEVISKEACP
jgi:Flp pilus assembly protein TadG